MEALSCLLKRARDGGFLSGWRVGGRGGEGVEMSHLLFADDTLVFCKSNSDHLTYLSWVLMWFEAISGLSINLEKSEIIPVGRVEEVDDLAIDFGCKVGELPSSYLGLPLGAPFKSVSVWDRVEERFRKKLALWRRQHLSKGGRVTLIQSTLSSMPIYFMSLFCLPRIVRMRLDQIQRDFLWGGGALERKPHLVRWSTVCSDKDKGGLGIKNLAKLNKALLGKWSWRFAEERGTLWKQVISGKYGVEEGGWCSKEVRGSYGVSLWKSIRKAWELLRIRTDFSIGNGHRVRFWRDKWCGNEALCTAFPALFALAESKDIWVAEVWFTTAEGGCWAPLFTRAFNDWELDSVDQFLARLQEKRVYREKEDYIRWSGTKNGKFSVKACYSSLENESFLPFPASVIWRSWAPLKVSVFAWEASWAKVLTLDRLKKRGWSLANRCYLCHKEEESIDHILLHCGKARELWFLVFSLFGVSWTLSASVRDMLLGWQASSIDKRRKKAWRAAPLCIFWTIWKERNRRAFENVEQPVQNLKNVFLYNFWEWSRPGLGSVSLSLVDFVDWLGSFA